MGFPGGWNRTEPIALRLWETQCRHLLQQQLGWNYERGYDNVENLEFDLDNWRAEQEAGLTMSTWWDIAKRDKSDGHDEVYHGCFVPQIPRYMIYRFTKPGDVVFDPMMGSGTTGIEAVKLGRHFLGVDLNEEVADAARKRIKKARKAAQTDVEVEIGCGDVMDLDLAFEAPPNLVMFHPPYLDIIKFNEEGTGCWSRLAAPEFLMQVRRLWNALTPKLADGAYVVTVIGDVWKDGSYYPLGFYLLQQLLCCDLELRGILVKNVANTKVQQENKNLWYYRAAKNGTFTFAHEYIIVMRRKK